MGTLYEPQCDVVVILQTYRWPTFNYFNCVQCCKAFMFGAFGSIGIYNSLERKKVFGKCKGAFLIKL